MRHNFNTNEIYEYEANNYIYNKIIFYFINKSFNKLILNLLWYPIYRKGAYRHILEI